MSVNSNGDPVARKRMHVQLEIDRPIYSETEFQKQYKHLEKDDSNLDKLKKRIDKIELTPSSLWRFIQRLVPIVKWLPNYKIKSDLLWDTISGITTGIMRVPQAMAYGILATLPAVMGLYVAFFSTLIYAIFGTSKHISVGTWAVLSIMVGDAIDDVVSAETSNRDRPLDADDETELRIQVAISLSLLVGFIQVGMGILRLGIITRYLSEPLVKGFTTGVAIHVFTSQFSKLFGVSVARYSGPLALIYTYIEFFSKLATANTCAIVISIISLLIFVVIGEINDRQAAKGWCRKDGKKGKKLPIPTELLVVVLATMSSYLGEFEEKYELGVVGDIPTGLPFPVAPPTKYFGSLIGAAIAIAVVGFAISIAMAHLYARKYNYEVDANQEFIAYGSCNIVSSFFQCYPSATSLSRTVVQEGAGGKTQLMWLVAFTLVVLLGVDLGLLLSMIFALITIVVRYQSPYCALKGRVPDTDIYRDISFVQDIEELPGIKIFGCSSSLCFINADHFKNSLYKKAGFNPQKMLIAREEKKDKHQVNSDQEAITSSSSSRSLHTVIIDCSMFTYVDLVGVKTLQAISADYQKVDVQVVFANCKGSYLL
ncbi:prestin-like [Amphiura filiformis]|uniref:prestin-like n=1 Tax=Amphiura filiformis TaxID=82378 RepID=UPI003B2173EF